MNIAVLTDQFAIDLDRDFPGYLAAWRFAVRNVGELESPLERLFLAHWVFATYRDEPWSYGDRHPITRETPSYHLCAQREYIDECHTYRVDFYLSVVTPTGSVLANAVIEIDGFAFHSDREAFERDRARDQYFQSLGISVFRFTHRVLQKRRPLINLLSWAEAAKISAPTPEQTFDFNLFLKRGFEAAIIAERGNPAEMKERIMLAYEHGHLAAHEAEDWIVVAGLVGA